MDEEEKTEKVEKEDKPEKTEKTLLEKIKGMTADNLKDLSNDELVDLTNISNGKTKTFCSDFKTVFTYSQLIAEIQRRGGKSGWFFPERYLTEKEFLDKKNSEVEIIKISKINKNSVEQTVMIDENVLKKWKTFVQKFPNKDIPVSLALKMFMKLYRSGKYKFLI